MGLAWVKRRVKGDGSDTNATAPEVDDNTKMTKFLTSSEWLETLDNLLPGQRFFTPQELEQRIDDRKENDAVTKGVEELLSGEMANDKTNRATREELVFPTFKKLWRKITC